MNINVLGLTGEINRALRANLDGESRLMDAFDCENLVADFVKKISDHIDNLVEERKKSTLIQNAVYNRLDGQFYVSRHRHDYVVIPLGEGHTFIDGGTDYQRRGFNDHPDLDLSFTLFEGSSESDLIDHLLWGTYGKNGDEPFRWVLLKDCSSEHLQNILENVPNLCPHVKKVCEKLLSAVQLNDGKADLSGN